MLEKCMPKSSFAPNIQYACVRFFTNNKSTDIQALKRFYFFKNFKSRSEDTSKSIQFVAFNTHSWPRREVVQLPDAAPDQLGNLVTQKLKCGGILGTCS